MDVSTLSPADRELIEKARRGERLTDDEAEQLALIHAFASLEGQLAADPDAMKREGE